MSAQDTTIQLLCRFNELEQKIKSIYDQMMSISSQCEDILSDTEGDSPGLTFVMELAGKIDVLKKEQKKCKEILNLRGIRIYGEN